jgi:FtsP/CotA-like multicopper oxidase with cupredoxin domain
MCASTVPLPLSALCRILLSLILLGCGCRVLLAHTGTQRVVANSNQAPAGRFDSGQLTIRLEAAMGEWSPEENDGPALNVAAFREEGGPLSTPGPLIRVPEGTEIDATISNRLEQPLTVHGLHSRPGYAKEVLIVAPGESREVKFLAGAPGTYLYWASRNGAETTVLRRAEDEQLNGAFVIDGENDARRANSDRILMITDWTVVDDDAVQPPAYREVFAINGLSWPHTERLTYRAAETVHWRIINAADSNHPMHLHGFYFHVDSAGDGETDTIYAADQRRMAVTELVRPGHTFTLTWTPDRSGNWVFHCHVLRHITPQLRYWKRGSPSPEPAMADHAREGMAGLVIGITILSTDLPLHAAAKPRLPSRKIELRATELPGFFGKDPGMAFAIKNPRAAIRPAIPGPPLILTRGEPTAIRVVNQLSEPLAVHWHGIELESYYDGVPGLSGSGQQLLKPIAPEGSFVVQMTPPRAGTFIYHTHINDIKQLSSGLYGPLIVLPPGEKFDPETDRVLVISRAGPGETPIWLNGSRSPMMATMRTGQTYRLRIINIVPENPPIEISLKVAGIPATWRPIAKDGADLPLAQRELCSARLIIGVGETYDFEFRPDRAGELALEVVRPSNRFPAQITPSHSCGAASREQGCGEHCCAGVSGQL